MQDDKHNLKIDHQDETNGAAVGAEPVAAPPAENIVTGSAAESVAAATKDGKELFDLSGDHDTRDAGANVEADKSKKERFDFRRRALIKELEQKEKEFDKLRDDHAMLALQHADLKDRYLRLAAEMENFRKRLEKEFFNRVESRVADLLTELLPVVDDLERLLGVGNEAKEYDSLIVGARLIHQNVLKILQNRGVSAMETAGKEFDPNRHEALLQMPAEGKAPNIVVQETAKGYLLFDKVLRPAKVIVSV
jgi:molecular chaperone GrpE